MIRTRGPLIPHWIRQPLTVLSIAILLVLLVVAVFAEQIGWRDPQEQFRGLELRPPGTLAPDGQPLLLGADALGRDIFSRIVHGSRISMYVGVAATAGAILIGTVLGLTAGYFGGGVDAVLQRIIDAFDALPGLVVAMVVAGVLNLGITGVIVALIISSWPRVARVARANAKLVREFDFVEAARAIGGGNAHIIARHIFPNVTSSLIVLATTALGGAVLAEAALSFLGVGSSDLIPTWGQMISQSRRYLTRAPHLLIMPAIALSLVVLALNLGGDALRDRLDPRMRGSR